MIFDGFIPVGKLAFAYELGSNHRDDLIKEIGASLVFEFYPECDFSLFSTLSIGTLWDGHQFQDKLLFDAIESLLDDGKDIYGQIEDLCEFVEGNGTNNRYDIELCELREIINSYEGLIDMADRYGHESYPPGTVKAYILGEGYDETDYFDVQFTSSFSSVGATPERTFKRNINVARGILAKKYCSIVSSIIFDIMLTNKESAVLFLNSIGMELLEDIDGLDRKYIKNTLASQNNKAIPKFSNTEITEKIQSVSKIVLAEWREKLEEYQKQPGHRHNDALYKRMNAYLRRLSGESATKIKKDYPDNFSRMIATAQNRDIPLLMSIFPDLPPLPKLTSATRG